MGSTNTNENNFKGIFSPTGSVQLAEYSKYQTVQANKNNIVWMDSNDNTYEIQSSLNTYPVLTYGTWNSNHTLLTDCILAKYDSAGTLLWKTYIPENLEFGSFIRTDAIGNIFIAGTTKWQNLGDTGTYEPNFTSISPTGTPISNSYLIKLNPQGQKIWATYITSKSITDMDVYANNAYLVTTDDINSTISNLSTANTFQQDKSTNAILKINGTNGQRIWGTYYGDPTNFSHGNINNIRVNATGVYVLGNSFNPGGYYGEKNSYKSSTSDGLDMFLSQFNETGVRTWGTYIGSDGFEINIINAYDSNRRFDVKNEKILVAGLSLGTQNIATPGSFLDVKPSVSNGGPDLFFALFSSNGQPDFISYYGSAWGGNNSGGYNHESINCKFSTLSDAFYLFGSTNRESGFTTPNAHQANIITPPNSSSQQSTFVAKFSLNTLSVSENNSAQNLALYNNPNDGSFYIKGDILGKQNHIVQISDASGRIIFTKKIEKKETEFFNLNSTLENGIYWVSIRNEDYTLIKTFKMNVKK